MKDQEENDNKKVVKKATSNKAANPSSFNSLGLDKEILNALNRMNYHVLTPVQRKALPLVLSGLDIVCMARTGSGKTCVFLLPMIQKLRAHEPRGVRGVVLSPTRELAVQTYRFTKDMAKFTDLRIANIFGGDSIDEQFDALASKPDILIATPGRLAHHLKEISTFKLKSVNYLVFDEADRLFEMGFAEQLHEIIQQCPKERQTLLFSATLPKMLVQFSRAGLRDPQLIRLDTDIKMSDELRISFFHMRSNEKYAALLYLVRMVIPTNQLTIIFTATRHHSELIHAIFNKLHIKSTMVYGSMDQEARSGNLKQFRNGEINYLIVTDLAARGLDVPLLNNVINFHFPSSPKLFVHRCGRAARQGRIGFAFSLVEQDELAYMMDVHTLLDKPVYSGYSTDTAGNDSNVNCLTLDESDDEEENEDDDQRSLINPTTGYQHISSEGYTLSTMTPEMVHFGILPQDAVDQENDFFKRLLQEDDQLQQLLRISENGFQQYKRTRGEATKLGVKRAKELLRSGRLSKFIHPLIAGMHPEQCSVDVLKKNDFIRSLQTFRPLQTVFETGIGTGQVMNKTGLLKATDVMKELRKTTKNVLQRNKDKGISNKDKDVDPELLQTLLKQTKDYLNDEGGDDEDLDNIADEFYPSNHGNDDDSDDENQSIVRHQSVKKRLSAAEKRKMKKVTTSGGAKEQQHASKSDNADQLDGVEINDPSSSSGNGHAKSTGSKFADPRFYMSYGNEDEKTNFAEESMQPLSALKSSEMFGTTMIDEAMATITGEDAYDLNKKKKITRWDPKKRKFVKQTLSEMAAAKTHGLKRMRSESGGNSMHASAKPQGELYEKWKLKRRREINDDSHDDDGGSGEKKDYRKVFKSPKLRVNSDVKQELRSKDEIKKLAKKRDNLKLKNMEKGKRRVIENKQRTKKKATQQKQLLANRKR